MFLLMESWNLRDTFNETPMASRILSSTSSWQSSCTEKIHQSPWGVIGTCSAMLWIVNPRPYIRFLAKASLRIPVSPCCFSRARCSLTALSRAFCVLSYSSLVFLISVCHRYKSVELFVPEDKGSGKPIHTGTAPHSYHEEPY